jgi:glycerophosphocholine phosphodiesterase GPCPD1
VQKNLFKNRLIIIIYPCKIFSHFISWFYFFLAFALTEVATLNGENYQFVPQEQFGRAYHKDDILVFHISVTEPENIAYLIDLYAYRSNADHSSEIPYHLGYQYVLPNLLKKSEGQIEIPITCASRHRPLGMMKMEFIKITPIDNPRCDMRVR